MTVTLCPPGRGGGSLLLVLAVCRPAFGRQGQLPDWQQLRAALGVPLKPSESARRPRTAAPSCMCWMSGRAMPCCFVRDGAYCLIDTGPVEAEDALLYDLDVLGVPSPEYLVLTHPHADHTGNARAVLRTSPVKTLLLPLWQPTADETADWPRHLAELAADSGQKFSQQKRGEEYPLAAARCKFCRAAARDARQRQQCLALHAVHGGRFPLSRYRRRRGRRRAAPGRHLRPDPCMPLFSRRGITGPTPPTA